MQRADLLGACVRVASERELTARYCGQIALYPQNADVKVPDFDYGHTLLDIHQVSRRPFTGGERLLVCPLGGIRATQDLHVLLEFLEFLVTHSPSLDQMWSAPSCLGSAISARCTPNPDESLVRAQLSGIRGGSDSGETRGDEEG